MKKLCLLLILASSLPAMNNLTDLQQQPLKKHSKKPNLQITIPSGPVPSAPILLLKPEDYTQALFEAARLGKSEEIQYLIEHGAQVNAKDKNGNTPLNTALEGASTKEKEIFATVKALVDNGADPRIKNKKGETALYILRTPAKFDPAVKAELEKLLIYTIDTISYRQNSSWDPFLFNDDDSSEIDFSTGKTIKHTAPGTDFTDKKSRYK